MLKIARARNGAGLEKRKPEIDEWPAVAEPFVWRPAEIKGEESSRTFPSQARHRWMRVSIFWLLLLAGAVITSAMLA